LPNGPDQPRTVKGTDEHRFSPPADIDTTKPHPARMYDFYLGGKDNYAADKEAAGEVIRARA